MAEPPRPRPSSPLDYDSDGTTLVDVVNGFETEGYAGQALVRAGGAVECRSCGTTSPAGEVEVDRLRRTEGASDPADMAAVMAVRCPSCGARATLVVHYGPTATPEESDVLSRLEDRR